MTKQKMTMEPGRRYKGYGFINEYGEVHFEASQKDDNPNRMKVVYSSEHCTLYESSDNFKIAVKIAKSSDRMDMVRDLMNKIQQAAVSITKYI